ncbi:MAG: hypothetical protein KAV82_15830, partial [Phycisphaerae bacterium]|nr:hypothetical protein [Phycisphaerae bacterium]
IHGADAVRQALDRVGDGAKHVGDKTEHAGKTSKDAGESFTGMGHALDRAGDAAAGFLSGFVGMQSVLAVTNELKAVFEQIVELQERMTRSATAAQESVMPLVAQRKDWSQAGFEQRLKDAMQLRIAAIMPSLEGAQALGIAADITLPGGFDSAADPEAFKRNLEIAASVGGALPTGTVSTYGSILEVIAAAGITDPEQIKLELARVLAAQGKSLSADPGSFTAGLAGKGIKSFLAGGGELTDAAILLLQARQAVSNDAEAATVASTILQVARGSTATKDFLGGKAGEFGFGDFDQLSDTELLKVLEQTFTQAAAGGPAAEAKLLRQGFEPGQFPVIKSAFSAAARDAAVEARKAMQGVSATDIDKQMADFATSQIGESRVQSAKDDYADAMTGMDVFYVTQLRRAAQRRLDRERASGQSPWLIELLHTDEQLVEREMRGLLEGFIERQESLGVDMPGARSATEKLRTTPSGLWGWDDKLLREAAQAVAGVSRGAQVPVVFNTTNIGTAYLDNMPDRHSPPYADVGD